MQGDGGSLRLGTGQDEALEVFLIPSLRVGLWLDLDRQGQAEHSPCWVGRWAAVPPPRLSPLCQLCSIMGNPLSFCISAVFRSALY